MDSEDSRDGSSGNESNDEGGQSPVSAKSQGASSTKSNASHSRSSSSESRVQSALSQHSQDTSNPQEDTPLSPEGGNNFIEDDTPHSPEGGNNFIEDSNHYKNVSHHSSDESQHSLDDSQHSEDRFNSSVNNQSPEGKQSPNHVENSPINSPKSISEGPQSPDNNDTKDKTFSGHSQASRDSSPDSQHSFNSSEGKRSLKDGENFENDAKRSTSPLAKNRSRSRSISPLAKNRSRSRSSSYSSDDNGDRNSKTSGNHIPKSPNNYKHSYASSPNTKISNNQSQSPDFSHSSSARKPTKISEKPLSDDDNESIKSGSSSSSASSKGSGKSLSSADSRSVGSRRSRRSTRSRKKSESSVSSDSSRSSSPKKNAVKSSDTHAEEISDGDMESDQENDSQRFKEEKRRPEINISHEDLSDVSDLEGSIGENLENDGMIEDNTKKDEDPTEYKNLSPDSKQISVKSKGTEEGEEQLDFEAEDGECAEIENVKEKDDIEEKSHTTEKEQEKPEEKKEAKELEEGEVTDEDDVRPEEVEPRPVCRFFSRGQCTWGASCRFLHPGVTDKGNYTMFEMIRPVVPGEFGRDERVYGKPEPPLIESAWERGLRTAKEMLRKSVKRKEQDIDFEEKKMNLSLAQEEFDKENGYYGRVPSPEPRYVRHIPAEYPMARPPPEEYYGRRQIHYEPEYAPLPPRERVRPYRELPPHRMPDYYNNKYEEEPPSSSNKRPKPKREVIVQRVEERQGRGDEWSDPWMRSKSPAGRRKERKRSYSSGSSYSSSSSSDSSRSTYRSRSRSSHRRRRSRSRRSRQVSPSVIVSERKAANERAALMNPPAPKRRAPSPGMMRVTGAANPPAPSRDDLRRSRSKLAAALARVKGRRSSRSSSGSSGSSSSDTDSSDSSSSSSRDESSPRRAAGVELSIAKAMDVLKSGGLEKNKIKLNLKNPVGMKKNDASDSRKPEQAQGKKRTASSPPPGDPKSKKATSRREELLKQLKAVEDAIAKKRSKVN